MIRNFMEALKARWAEGKFVCVGLDSELSKIPAPMLRENVEDTLVDFNRSIIEATKDLVCAYKLNLAFYVSKGLDGITALWRTFHEIPEIGLWQIPMILDAKFGDIGNTNNGYVEFAFDEMNADAVTVHNYLGKEAMKPFLDRKDKGIIVLCRTSNPRAGEFQDLKVLVDKGMNMHSVPLFQAVAKNIAEQWNENGNCCVVAGATYPEELGIVRKIVSKMPILIPGIGAQSGDVQKTVQNGQDENGQGMIINSSRGIIFASDPRGEALKLHNAINQHRKKVQ